jgi:NhaP-type Na+/H+ or K+/H+ antiporter
VATGYDASVPALIVFIGFALIVARPVAVEIALLGTDIPRPQNAFMSWFGPKGVASMLFALLVLDGTVDHRTTVFDVASFVIVASIVIHGLTDTIGARWIERRMQR